MNGVFAEGEQLKEIDLAERFNVSRSPVREALRRLSGDGILEISPNRGIFVREFSAKYIADVLELRIILEKRGLERAPQMITSEIKREMLTIRGEMKYVISHGSYNLEKHDAIDAEFHNLIMDFNDNEFISEVAQTISALNAMFRNVSLRDPNRAIESQMEHIALIDSLLEGKIETATKINEGHIERTKKRVLTELEKRRQARL
ncbi:MAG: GntR family transcriptional regulator [Anaerotruncus sp.]|nr:GntR family transcriptional regulator [Anaerotruncus sp.]